jgi:hypothetical protein
MAQLNFNAADVPPNDVLEAIPAGWYNVMIDYSETKPTKNGRGSYLELSLKVLDGPYAGRKVFDRLNLQNDNAQAVEIAYRQLSAYCHATGVIQVQDSQQLHGIPFMAKIAIETDSTGQYEPSNKVKTAKKLEGAAVASGPLPNFPRPTAGGASAAFASPSPATTPAPTAAPKPPWA